MSDANYSGLFTGLFANNQKTHDKIVAEAAAMGVELVGFSEKSYKKRLYKILSCGHTVDLEVANVRSGRFGCKPCTKDRMESDAAANGMTIIGPGKDCNRRMYRFIDCGHEQECAAMDVRHCGVVCHQCNITYLDKPSEIYVLLIENGGEQIIKLGYTRNMYRRQIGYSLPSDTKVTQIYQRKFKTAREAIQMEKLAHKKLKGIKMKPDAVSHIMRGDGRSECYSPKDLPMILACLSTFLGD